MKRHENLKSVNTSERKLKGIIVYSKKGRKTKLPSRRVLIKQVSQRKVRVNSRRVDRRKVNIPKESRIRSENKYKTKTKHLLYEGT